MLGIIFHFLRKQAIMLKNDRMKGISYSIRRSVKTGSKKQPTLPVHGIVFDLDGTLTLPVLDFAKLRSNLQCPKGVDILQFCNSKSGSEKELALRLVEEFEEEGRKNTKLQPGVFELLKFLSQCGLKRALITRNSQASVDKFLDLLGHPDNYGGPLTHVRTTLLVSFVKKMNNWPDFELFAELFHTCASCLILILIKRYTRKTM